MNYTSTQIKILEEAECLIQTKGYNAFSYKDISDIVQIKTSSIHYHYSSKELLGVAVIQYQIDKLSPLLLNIQKDPLSSPQQKILALIELIFSTTYKDRFRMCLGGMLAAELLSLPESLKSQVVVFFDLLSTWIEKVSLNKKSKQLLMLLEGGLLFARLYDEESFLDLVRSFIKENF